VILDNLYEPDQLLLGWATHYNLRPIPTAHKTDHLIKNFKTMKEIKLDQITETGTGTIAGPEPGTGPVPVPVPGTGSGPVPVPGTETALFFSLLHNLRH
jgi:hypothetical protein